MRFTRTTTRGLICFALMICALGLCEYSLAEDPAPEVLAEFEYVMTKPPVLRVMVEVNDDGTVELVPAPGIPASPYDNLKKGYYLGMALSPTKRVEDNRIVLIRLEEIEDERISARVGRDAAKEITKGNYLGLFRPGNVSDKELIKLPHISHVASGDPPKPGEANYDITTEHVRLLKAQRSMKELGVAMHNYHAAHGSFPPTFAEGPDGKPWHSWRVLLLPHLRNGKALYEKYKLDEPWDSPHNKKLLDKKPAVYSDPIESNAGDSQFTHVAALTGEGLLFSPQGTPMENGSFDYGSGTKISQILDGSSNTLMLGPVSAAAEIPWTKPEDLSLTESSSVLDSKGGFALDYKSKGERVGPFLISNGSVGVFTADNNQQMLQGMITIAGGESIDLSEFKQTDDPQGRATALPIATITLVREGDRTTAYLKEK